jgi:opacity protein-like surface antigen
VALHLIDSAAFSGAPDGGRDYGRFGLNIEWAFVESWSLIAGYEYYYWINAAIDHDARSNSVLVGFNYRKAPR